MRALLLLVPLFLISGFATAETVHLEMRPRIMASADYSSGQRSKPAVLLLHGFLQTRDFPTVASLARGLKDAGYSVLTPTLSLGIPGRRQSLACEAVHHHSLDEDVAEIARWVGWLKSRGHPAIVLIGHSFGSMQLLAYLGAHPDRAIRGYLGASLVEAQIGATDRSLLLASLHAQGNQPRLVTQNLSFCKKYTSTPAALLSYVRWDQARTLATLRSVPVSVQLIMGGADSLVERNWISALKQAQAPIVVVPGGNHFLDGEHEFDLLEHSLSFLERLPKDAAQ